MNGTINNYYYTYGAEGVANTGGGGGGGGGWVGGGESGGGGGVGVFFFLMIRRPPRSTLDRSSAASDVYKRQGLRYFIETGKCFHSAVKNDQDFTEVNTKEN